MIVSRSPVRNWLYPLTDCTPSVEQAFKKSPENPFNQATVAFDATKEEKVEALKALRAQTEQRLKDRE